MDCYYNRISFIHGIVYYNAFNMDMQQIKKGRKTWTI